MNPRQHPRRRSPFRRPPAIHRPAPVAPETPEEVLERAPVSCPWPEGPCLGEPCPDPECLGRRPDVSRETWAEVEAAVELTGVPQLEEAVDTSLRYVAGGQVPPPLHKSQVARLEALTAVWTREVRLEVPPDATMLGVAPRPPVPPPAGRWGASRPPEPASMPPGPAPAPYSPAAADQLRDALAQEILPARRVSDWVSRHDPRSLEYAARDRLRVSVPLADVLLELGPILDQGTTPPLSLREASACTGMAAAAAANVLYLGPDRGDSRAGYGLHREDEARHAYELAQDLDEQAGHDYAGTSVLAVMKAGQELGWWDTYLWALSGTRDVAQVLLQLRAPVVIGIPWPEGMEDPDAAGIVRPTGPVGMGHCLTVVGLRREPPPGSAAVPGAYFVLQQSRGTTEGDGGLLYLHNRDLATLLRGTGEAAVPLPRGI